MIYPRFKTNETRLKRIESKIARQNTPKATTSQFSKCFFIDQCFTQLSKFFKFSKFSKSPKFLKCSKFKPCQTMSNHINSCHSKYLLNMSGLV